MVSAEMKQVVEEVQKYVGGKKWIRKILELTNWETICVK
jgi:hypothetical protein